MTFVLSMCVNFAILAGTVSRVMSEIVVLSFFYILRSVSNGSKFDSLSSSTKRLYKTGTSLIQTLSVYVHVMSV
jgi:predicted nucleic acid binding AN1-type Zn finger protein